MSCQNRNEGETVVVSGCTGLRTVVKINPDYTTGLGVHVHEVVTEGPDGNRIYHFDAPSAWPISDIQPV